jgi:alginate O-acetyltransferase complex protein AlgI
MIFVDNQFAYFLAVVLLLWWLTRGRYALRLAVLLLASLFFYGYGRSWWLAIILAYCVVDWGTGRWLERTSRPRTVLALGLSFNVGVLCFWKYTPLLLATLSEATGWPAAPFTMALAERWVIPMGISFYAFTGIAYMVDVYRKTVPAEQSFWRYSLFTTFFPHLVAGPILRAKEFLWHLQPTTLPDQPRASWEGTFLIARGYMKKTVIADNIAAAIDPFFAHVADPSTAGVWSLPYVYLYALQIYFDFSGYTDIARGLGLWFGFRWPENFNWPYLATSIQEFWRRWHMTLSRFLRDYLYIPLGGNRHGPLRAAAALMITMLLGGLWHGASWSFMLWGGLHGVFLVVNRLWGATALHDRLAALSGPAKAAWGMARIFLTFHAVCFAWCFFRLTVLSESLVCVQKWFVFDADKMLVGGAADGGLWLLLAAYALVTIAAIGTSRGASLAEVEKRSAERPLARGAQWGAAFGFLLLAMALHASSESTPFIYFQF